MNRRYTLKRNKDFHYVYRTGKSAACKNLVLVYRLRKTPEIKIGFSVSKKIGESVVRNKIRRRMKEAMRSLLPHTDKRVLMILIARQPIVNASYQKIESDIAYLLKKAGLNSAELNDAGLNSNE